MDDVYSQVLQGLPQVTPGGFTGGLSAANYAPIQQGLPAVQTHTWQPSPAYAQVRQSTPYSQLMPSALPMMPRGEELFFDPNRFQGSPQAAPAALTIFANEDPKIQSYLNTSGFGGGYTTGQQALDAYNKTGGNQTPADFTSWLSKRAYVSPANAYQAMLNGQEGNMGYSPNAYAMMLNGAMTPDPSFDPVAYQAMLNGQGSY